MKKIISPLTFNAEQIAQVKAVAPDYQLVTEAEQASLAEISEAEIIFGWSDKFAPLLKQDNQLKWLQTKSVGVDYLPLTQLAAQNIITTTTNGANAENVAQQVLSYMLVYERKLWSAFIDQQEHKWDRTHPVSELTDKTLVMFGTGQIGEHVAKLAQAFGMHVIGINRHGGTKANFDEIMTFTAGEKQLAHADYVVNAMPLTAATTDYFNAALFAQMNAKTFFISVGRGPSTNSADLITALNTNQIAGAALDVVPDEPLSADDPLWDTPNLMITPHVAGFSNLEPRRNLHIFTENLKQYLKDGQPQINRLDYQRGY